MAKLILKDVRFSYANVFEPKAIGTSTDLKYSCTLLWPKDNVALTAAVKKALAETIAEGAEKKCWTAQQKENFLAGKFPSNFKYPLKDGDIEKPGKAEYEGMYYIQTNSKEKPGVVSTERDEFGKLLVLTSASEFYSGCYGNASVNFFPFNKDGGIGIGAGLGNLQKVKDGERLSGGASAWDDFDNEDDLTQ